MTVAFCVRLCFCCVHTWSQATKQSNHLWRAARRQSCSVSSWEQQQAATWMFLAEKERHYKCWVSLDSKPLESSLRCVSGVCSVWWAHCVLPVECCKFVRAHVRKSVCITIPAVSISSALCILAEFSCVLLCASCKFARKPCEVFSFRYLLGFDFVQWTTHQRTLPKHNFCFQSLELKQVGLSFVLLISLACVCCF